MKDLWTTILTAVSVGRAPQPRQGRNLYWVATTIVPFFSQTTASRRSSSRFARTSARARRPKSLRTRAREVEASARSGASPGQQEPRDPHTNERASSHGGPLQ